MIRVALRGVRAHVVRFLLSALAVALGVAFVVGTFAFRSMLSSTFDDIVSTTLVADSYVRGATESAGSDTQAFGAGDPRSPIPLALADDVAQVDGVARAYPDISGPIVLLGADDNPVVTGGAPSTVVAVRPDDPGLRLTSGEWPEGPDEMVLEAGAASLSGLTTGDSTSVVLSSEPRTVRVSGVFAIGSATAGAVIVGVDEATAEAAYAPDGLVPTISVYADPGIGEQTLTDRVAAVLPDSAEAVTGDQVRDETRAAIEELLGFIETFLLVFAAISLFVGAFIITNTFAMSVRERLREFALLRALGASPGQVFASILTQAVAVGLLGSAAGVLLGRGLVALLRVVLSAQGMELAGRVPLGLGAIGLALAVGVGVSVVAAAVPARRAALTPPVQAMHDDVTPERGTGTRALVGALVTLVGGGLLVLASWLGGSASASPSGWAFVDDLNPRTLLSVGASAVLLGVLVLSPAIAGRVIGVVAAPLVATVRPLARLARGNVTRSPRRTANTAGALMIGMALVSATGVIAASTQASVRSIVDQEMRADFMIQSATFVIPPGAADAVAGIDVVASAASQESGSVLVGGADVSVAGVPATFFPDALEAQVVDGDPEQALADGEAVVRRSAARDNEWEVGDEVTLGAGGDTGAGAAPDAGDAAGDAAPGTVTIGAIIDTQAISSDLILPEEVYSAVVPAGESSLIAIYVTGAAGVTPTELRAALTDAVQPYLVLTALDPEQVASAFADQVDQVLVILYALLGLSIIIALLGIVNTLALSIIERTREIGLLRAVGLGRLQLAGIITIESVLTAVYGTVLGVATGIAIATALPGVLADEGLTTLAIPWTQVLGVLGLAVVIGLVASVWPGIRASRLPVLEAVTVD